jgi:hypothetical protein
MLICGQVNPAPIQDTNYRGVYFAAGDDLEGKTRRMGGTPLRVEHNGEAHVGRVLQGWMDKRTGTAWALAEIDVSSVQGALTAAAVQQGAFKEFSLGYSSKIQRNPVTGKLEACDKQIKELSIVKNGARPNCVIAAHTPAASHTRSIIHKRSVN